MRVSSPLWDALVFAAMVMAECASIGLITLSKAAMSRGMSNFIFIMYSYALATLILLPFACFFHRPTLRPITFSLLCKMFLLGLIGYLVQVFAYTGINYSSPTLSAAMSNLTPAFTFILAVLFRMEKLHWKSSSSQAKSIGTIVSISGAFVVTLYKGPPIMMDPSSSNSLNRLHLSSQSNWVIGGIFFAADCLLSAIWYNFQAAIVKEYPEELTLTCLYSFFGTFHSAIGSLIAERDQSAWILKPDLALITIVYSAILGFGFSVGTITWALHQKGPLYVAMFRPLGIVIAVVMGVLFLGDTFYLGSMVGSITITAGFYAVIWGKSQEEKLDKGIGVTSLESSTERAPLLQGN
ncbi:WAT1-related protein At5g40240-like isoform X3 [Telopea speciosissima]|uniref:WAT1-related protein At5g40240-like isoform X3 n=1 Tax=Telopea speciosissima TaxID=54955 RepID=UPI001CC7231D|nr:WAT1-related protein At5g40240-like isoform X3 [Telopea speciosissima]